VARAETEEAAREIAGQVRIATLGTIRADGPAPQRSRHGWSVSYRLHVPRRSDLRLESRNGGIHLRDLAGNASFTTANAGVHLARR
jgi:hypothetical protein